MTSDKPRFRAARLVFRAALIGAALVALGAVAAPVIVRGPRFGRVIEWVLPAMRGHIYVGGGRWTWGTVLSLVRQRPASILLEDIRIVDPEGTEVLRVRRVSAEVEVDRRARRVVIDGVTVKDAVWRFADMKHGGAGFLAAFQSAAAARPAKPGSPSGGSLEIRGVELDGLDVTFDLRDWGLALKDVHGTASIAYSSQSGHGTPTFEVQGADARGGGELRVLGRAPNWRLPFSHARLDRVATTADAFDAIQLAASAVTTGRSVLSLEGSFTGVYSGRKPGMELRARMEEASDAARFVATSHGVGWPSVLRGERLRLTATFAGPFAGLRIGAETSLALADGGRIDGEGNLELRRLTGSLKMAFTQVQTAPLLPTPLVPLAGGRLDGAVQVGFELGRPAIGLSALDLTLMRPPGVTGSRVVHLLLGPAARADARPPGPAGWTLDVSGGRFADGALHLPWLKAPLWGGRVAVSGDVTLGGRPSSGALAAPAIDLMVVADHVSSAHLLGPGFLRGPLSFRGRARGQLPDVAVDLALSRGAQLVILGQRFRLPDRVGFRIGKGGLRVPTVRLGGLRDSELTAGGQIGLDGQLDVAVGVRAFPFDKLPGFAETKLPLSGRLSGRLALTGKVERVAMAGEISIEPVTFQGRHVGGGHIALSTEPSGAIHARGRLVEGIGVDGILASTPAGLKGEATVALEQLRLDPFLSQLPGGVSALGTLSGTIAARISPGQSPQVDGRLTQLTLTVIPPVAAGSGRPVRPLDLRSQGDIRFSAQSGDGAIRLGPAHFTGGVGSFEIEGASQGHEVSGALRGHIQLEGFLPVTSAWVDRLSGAIDVDLRAGAGADGRYLVKGDVSVASPLAFQVRSVPFATRIPAGRIHFSGDSIETVELPVIIDGRMSGPVTRAEGSARLTARVAGTTAEPEIRAAIALDRLRLQVPSLGAAPVEVTGGRIDFDGRTLVMRAIPIRVGQAVELTVGKAGGPEGEIELDALTPLGLARLDLPVDGQVRGLDLQAIGSPGVRIDQAAFALRLRGPREALRLAGDVEISGAHARANAKAAPKKGAKTGAPSTAAPALPPELERTQLDVRIRSKSGAVVVDVPYLPDLRVDVDYRVQGTLKSPTSSGRILPTGAYSSFLLWLRRVL